MKIDRLLLTFLLAGFFIVFGLSQANADNEFDYGYGPDIIEALHAKDTATVLAKLEDAINLDPGFAPNYLLKGKILFERENYESALEQFETAFKKKSKLFEALYFKGLTLLRMGKIKDAEKTFNEGIKKAKNGEKAMFHNGLGLSLLERGQKADSMALFTQADVEFRKAISDDSTKSEYNVNLGDANYFAQIYPLAINEYKKVIETDTTNLVVFFRLARAYVAMGQYNNALEQLRTVLIRDSMYAGAWKEAGRLYTMAGLSAHDQDTKLQRFREAIGSYEKYISLTDDSTDGEVFFNIGRSYFNLGGFAQADSALSYVLSLGDVPRNIYLYLGRSEIGIEKYQSGIDYLKKHLAWLKEQDEEWQPGPEDADIYRRMGDAYKAIDDMAAASENYMKAAELNPENGRYALEAALAAHRNQDFELALDYYKKRIDIGPDEPSIFLNASFCLLRMEQYEEAVDYLTKVVELDSTNYKAISLLASTCLNQLQDCENGIKWSEKALAIDSTDCDIIKGMGLAYFVNPCTTNYPRSITYLKRALNCYNSKGMDNCGNVDLVLYIAQAYHLYAAELSEANKEDDSRANFKNAYDWYNKVLKCDPNNADAKKGVQDTEFEF